VDETFVMTFRVASALPVVHYTVDFLDPDGERRIRVQGKATGGDTVPVLGRFAKAGAGTVLIRGVTDQGISGASDYKVQVR
jgi:hypothetical protein